MAKMESVAARAMRQVSNLAAVYERLVDPATLERRLTATRPSPAPMLESVAAASEASPERRLAGPGARAEILASEGRKAIEKVRKDGANARLSPTEETALEAIVLLEGRPALLVTNGRFEDPPEEWTVLNAHREGIEATLGSVGRIEVTGHPSLDWIGTGFLVADGVVMTNRHVAKEFSRKKGAGWAFEAGMKARIDYVEELGAKKPAEFALTAVIGIHDTYDLALLKASRKTPQGARAPEPLLLAENPKLRARGRVYVVGYPAWDGRRNEPTPMSEIFRDIYNVKRLQPGEIAKVAAARKEFEHDCSTLGGNSGSCVIDLETQRVVGLHFAGRYRQANYAVILSKLRQDPLIKKAKIAFA